MASAGPRNHTSQNASTSACPDSRNSSTSCCSSLGRCGSGSSPFCALLWKCSNASRIPSRSFTTSRTNVSSLPGAVRFRRERVCTADDREALVDVHRVQQQLVEAGLVRLGDDQHPV